MPNHFADRLCEAVKTKGTPLTVGLDPVYDRLPEQVKNRYQTDKKPDNTARIDAISDFCRQVLQVVGPLVPVVKINIAFFEKYLWDGLESYYTLIYQAQRAALQTIGDVKRSDIGNTAKLYAAAHLKDCKQADTAKISTPDAVTINGFAGAEGILPFADTATEQGKGVFVWVRSSNPGAEAIQCFSDNSGKKMYEKIAEVVGQIADAPQRTGTYGYSNIGMVVGGTCPEETSSLRDRYQKVWFLVPGYGSQGASAAECVRFCKNDGTGALINSSRSIIYAYENLRYREQFGADWKRCIEQAVIDAKIDIANAMQNRLQL